MDADSKESTDNEDRSISDIPQVAFISGSTNEIINTEVNESF